MAGSVFVTTAFRVAAIAAALVGMTASARAQVESPYDISPGDAAFAVSASALAALAIELLPANAHEPGNGVNRLDTPVLDNFNRGAAWSSQFLLVTTLVAPAALFVNRPVDDVARDRALLYGEAIAFTALSTNVLKHVIGRPRPYTHNPNARDYVREQGKDASMSFPSGHASFAFAAAVSGGILYAMETDDVNLRATAWGAQLALATMTANFRVRAGKHFYSDILAGALLGTGVSAVVVMSQSRDGYTPTGTEIGAMAGGIVVGALLSEVFPIGDDPLDKKQRRLALTPIGSGTMTGFAVQGGF